MYNRQAAEGGDNRMLAHVALLIPSGQIRSGSVETQRVVGARCVLQHRYCQTHSMRSDTASLDKLRTRIFSQTRRPADRC